MLSKESLKFLEELLKSSGPSGFEYKTAAIFRKYLGSFADRVFSDVMGNTIGVLNEDADFNAVACLAGVVASERQRAERSRSGPRLPQQFLNGVSDYRL